MRLRALPLFVVVALVFIGCGGATGTDGDAPTNPAALDHADGIVVVEGDGFVLSAPDGRGDDLTFELGPGVDMGEVRAIEASGATARVVFRPGQQPLVAAAIRPAPQLGDELETFEGRVVSANERELVVAGAGGQRTFDVSQAAEGSFDVPHLLDHADNREPIRVYFDPAKPDVAVAYEDA
jgi:hypothetical protein